jgi:hypothetical protein
MAKRLEKRLSAREVATLTEPGYYPDGGNLYLQISDSGTKSWIFRYVVQGRERHMGLGAFPITSLSEARDDRDDYRKQLRKGIDPLAEKEKENTQTQLEKAKSITFDECAKAYIKSNRADWKNEKHAEQWEATIKPLNQSGQRNRKPLQGFADGLNESSRGLPSAATAQVTIRQGGPDT